MTSKRIKSVATLWHHIRCRCPSPDRRIPADLVCMRWQCCYDPFSGQVALAFQERFKSLAESIPSLLDWRLSIQHCKNCQRWRPWQKRIHRNNPWVEFVVKLSPGPGSGKMATSLSQLYHDHKRGIKAGYAKFEIFLVWNLRSIIRLTFALRGCCYRWFKWCQHDWPRSIWKLTAPPLLTITRDVEIFLVPGAMFDKIVGECPYKSPNRHGCKHGRKPISLMMKLSAKLPVGNRSPLLHRSVRSASGTATEEIVYKLELLMKKLVSPSMTARLFLQLSRKLHSPVLQQLQVELPDGTIVTGKTSDLLGASSALLLNALKVLAASAMTSIWSLSYYRTNSASESGSPWQPQSKTAHWRSSDCPFHLCCKPIRLQSLLWNS